MEREDIFRRGENQPKKVLLVLLINQRLGKGYGTQLLDIVALKSLFGSNHSGGVWGRGWGANLMFGVFPCHVLSIFVVC